MKYVFFKILFTVVLLFVTAHSTAQNPGDFFKLTWPVKIWVLTHPFSACKALAISREAVEMTDKKKNDNRLDSLYNGGKLDAFRHAYWMALLARQFNCNRAYKLGNAHERGNILDFKKAALEEGQPVDSVSIAMDLYNNCVGVQAGFNNPEVSNEVLAEIIISQIIEGQMLIINRNEIGQFLNCDGQIIEETAWKGKWNNERCLVNSDSSAGN